jgi:Predicted nucleotidyltransferases
MEIPALITQTDNQQVNAILAGIIGILETALPGRIKSYYLHGSFADGTGIETSDIDLFIVAHTAFSSEERSKIQQLALYASHFSAFFIEIIALNEQNIRQQGHYRVKAASQLIWGEDIRQQLPDQTLEQYLQFYAHFPFVYLASMLRNSDSVTLPLDYPQASGEFFGYDQALMPPENKPCRNIKKLVTGACWSATVLIAWQAGQFVPGKSASIAMYRQYINDQWAPFLEELYEWGNRRWHYLVPQQPAERQHLRALCTQALAFENHYLQEYRHYLQAQQKSGGPQAENATQHLQHISG